MVLIGHSGAGKTALSHALAKNFTAMKRKTLFVSTKSLDPLGLVTRNGDMSKMGAFVFNDAPLRTMMSTNLDNESMKSLLDVREACAFRSRYHDAVLPAAHARLFSCNSGVNYAGAADPGAYFATYGLHGLACMARRDLAAVNSISDDERALCRRVVMFTPTASDIGFNSHVLRQAAEHSYAAEQAVLQAFLAQA